MNALFLPLVLVFGVIVAIVLFVIVGLLLDLVPSADQEDESSTPRASGGARRSTHWRLSLLRHTDPHNPTGG